MDKSPQVKVQEALLDIEYNCSVIQVQVMNNLDALLNPEGNGTPPAKLDLALLNTLVKGPMMRAVTKIKHARMVILKNSH